MAIADVFKSLALEQLCRVTTDLEKLGKFENSQMIRELLGNWRDVRELYNLDQEWSPWMMLLSRLSESHCGCCLLCA